MTTSDSPIRPVNRSGDPVVYVGLRRDDPRRVHLPDVDETRLGVAINHGRRLAALQADWDFWESLVPEPGPTGPESEVDAYTEAIAAVLLAARYAGLHPADVCLRASAFAADLLHAGREDSRSREEWIAHTGTGVHGDDAGDV